MIVEMRARISGTRNGQDWPQVGETISLPDAEARDMIAAGLVVEVADAPKPQTAAAPKPRTAKAPKAETR